MLRNANIGKPVREIEIVPAHEPIPEPFEFPERREAPLPDPSQPIIDPDRVPA